MTVEWDPEKSAQNAAKHGVHFYEAQELLLSSVDYLEVFDAVHCEDEDRFIAIGPTAKGILVVVWTEREEDTVRLISARRATRREHGLYHAYLEGRS